LRCTFQPPFIIRLDIEKLEYDGYPGVRITASMGVSELSPKFPSLKDMFIEADRNLYLAKHSGRNRIFPTDGPEESIE